MKTYSITSTQELRHILSQYGDGYLFRGQARHFDKNGIPDVTTSFDRHGCIPSQMLKWSRYASNVLNVFARHLDSSLDYDQAILQHYGWRSFFVDCSASAAVSAWFASHVYDEKTAVELCEDCTEDPVMLIKRQASYAYQEGDGHLYIFDKMRADKDVGLVDLGDLNVEGGRARTAAQQAWLLGTLRHRGVPSSCFVAHIRGPRSAFRDYAHEAGFVATNDLFPTSREDPILRALLGLPWKKVPASDEGGMIPFFRRTLELPEYHESFVKIAPPSTAFFEGARVADFGPVDGVKVEHLVMRVPNIALFGSAREPAMYFPRISALLGKHRGLVFEIDELIQHANMNGGSLYQKGIALMAHAPDLVELGELMVEHPGRTMTAAGMVRGWFYSVSGEGEWSRVEHPDQCPCASERTHQSHLSAMRIIEHFLADPSGFDD